MPKAMVTDDKFDNTMLLITDFYHLAFLPEAEDSPMICDQGWFGSLNLRRWQNKGSSSSKKVEP